MLKSSKRWRHYHVNAPMSARSSAPDRTRIRTTGLCHPVTSRRRYAYQSGSETSSLLTKCLCPLSGGVLTPRPTRPTTGCHNHLPRRMRLFLIQAETHAADKMLMNLNTCGVPRPSPRPTNGLCYPGFPTMRVPSGLKLMLLTSRVCPLKLEFLARRRVPQACTSCHTHFPASDTLAIRAETHAGEAIYVCPLKLKRVAVPRPSPRPTAELASRGDAFPKGKLTLLTKFLCPFELAGVPRPLTRPTTGLSYLHFPSDARAILGSESHAGDRMYVP